MHEKRTTTTKRNSQEISLFITVKYTFKKERKRDHYLTIALVLLVDAEE